MRAELYDQAGTLVKTVGDYIGCQGNNYWPIFSEDGCDIFERDFDQEAGEVVLKFQEKTEDR